MKTIADIRIGSKLHPDGLQFKRRVTLALSCRGADLTGVDEARRMILYFNGAAGIWEPVPGSAPDPPAKAVSAPLFKLKSSPMVSSLHGGTLR